MNAVRRALLALALVAGLLLPGLLLPGLGAPASAQATGAARAGCQRTLASYPTLRPGDRKPAVRTLQCSLNDLGLGPVAVDGFYGPQTKAAVKSIVDGFEGDPPHPYRINNGMWTLLFGCQLPRRTLAEGDHGHAVTVLQRALRAAGGTVAVDGDFGPQTTAVVKRYQKAQGMTQTGRVNGRTRFILCMGGVIGQLD
jgi:peptidoglycan hydrolase-like protein with peptidoglycan-binding domain